MSAAGYQELIANWTAIWNEGRYDLLDQVYDPTFVGHAGGQIITGIEAAKALVVQRREPFPDLEIRLEDAVAEGDTLAVRWTMTGTHRGPLPGLQPTGRRFEAMGMNFGRIKDSRFVELRSACYETKLLTLARHHRTGPARTHQW